MIRIINNTVMSKQEAGNRKKQATGRSQHLRVLGKGQEAVHVARVAGGDDEPLGGLDYAQYLGCAIDLEFDVSHLI